MAARIRKYQTEKTREKISTDRIVAFLQAGIFGTKFQGKTVELSSEKVSAAKTLLSKRLPDLSATTLSGDVTITHESQLEQLK
jgi:hypothetical protein